MIRRVNRAFRRRRVVAGHVQCILKIRRGTLDRKSWLETHGLVSLAPPLIPPLFTLHLSKGN